MPNATKAAIMARIDEGLRNTGLSDHAASLKAGLKKDAIRDLRRKPKTMPTLGTLEALAPVLEMTPGYLAFNQRGRGGKSISSSPTPIRGEVAAGLWLELSGSDEPEFDEIAIPFHSAWPREAQYGLIVRGTSINVVAQPGDVLQCVDLGIAGADAKEGDLVIVERRRMQAGQREVTAKRFRRKGRVIELAPESTDPRWREPFVIDPRKASDDEEIATIAIVVGVYRQLKRP